MLNSKAVKGRMDIPCFVETFSAAAEPFSLLAVKKPNILVINDSHLVLKVLFFCWDVAVVGHQLVAYVYVVHASHHLLFFILATEIGLYFPRVALGGFFFGLVAGRVTVFWLQHVFNDALVEITITLASTYLTFYIGEEVLGISGVIAVVMLGIEINSLKTSISPEVEVFLHR